MPQVFEDKPGEHNPSLAIRLSPAQSRQSRLNATLLLALFLAAVAVAAALIYSGLPPAAENPTLCAIAWIAPIALTLLLTILLLWSALRQQLALLVPMLTVEIDQQPITPGTPFLICVSQPGPVNLRSLRVNLVGSEQWSRPDERPTQVDRRRAPSRCILEKNLLDTGAAKISAGGYRQWSRRFHSPIEAAPSARIDETSTRWMLELWGVGRFGLMGFHYQFPIKVAERNT